MAMLTLKTVCFQYPMTDTYALDSVSFSVEKGAFITVCGETGCGKTTLLRMLKRELTPKGIRTGEILFEGTPVDALTDRISASAVGFVAQQPEQQIVTDRVWHELSFGLENLGISQAEIRRRVAEMASYFGITDWFLRDTASLSGGQKQLLNLAAVMVMQPRLLILDEPTAQLDPIAAADFIATLKRLNRDFSLTVILTEHRLEEVVPVSHKLLVLEQGRVKAFAPPRDVLSHMDACAPLMGGMPAAVRFYGARPVKNTPCPLTIREGSEYLAANFAATEEQAPFTQTAERAESVLEVQNISLRYGRNDPDILSDCSLTVHRGECFCLLGDNGAGKSTLLKTAAGLLRPYEGKIRVLGKKITDYRSGTLYRNCIAMLPQDVQTLFVCSTVKEELAETAFSQEAFPIDLSPLMDRHPYDLSGGQQQLVGLAKIMGQNPKLLLLDEPTKGLDAAAKQRLGEILRTLCQSGMAVLIVTHDMEFAAEYADCCGLLFRGGLIASEAPRPFFSGNYFYTTPVHRMSHSFCKNAVTVRQLADCCRLKQPEVAS